MTCQIFHIEFVSHPALIPTQRKAKMKRFVYLLLLTRPREKNSNQQTPFSQSNTQEYEHGLEGLIAK